MPKRIIFQFEDDLDYQIQAIHSTVELFRGLSRHVDGIYRPSRTRKFGEGDPVRNNDIVVGSRLLENLRKVQLANGLFADNVLAEGNNGLTLLMWKKTRFIAENFILKQYPMMRSLIG